MLLWDALSMSGTRDDADHAVVVRDALVKATFAAGTAVASGGGGSLAVLAGVGTFAGELSPLVLKEWRGKGKRIDRMAEAAVDAVGSPGALIQAIEQAPGGASLLTRAVEAAATSEYPPSVVAIGRALAEGVVDDGTRLDEARQFVEALSVVQRPHFVVMWELRADSDVPSGDGSTAWVPLTLNRAELVEALPSSYRLSLDRLVSTLEREGLIDRGTSGGAFLVSDDPEQRRPQVRDQPDMYWAITTFGLQALARLVKEGAGAEEDRP